MAGSISPSAPTIDPNDSVALVASGVTPDMWYVKPGGIGGPLSGVSGLNATYDAPGSGGTDVVRSEDDFWGTPSANASKSATDNSVSSTGNGTTIESVAKIDRTIADQAFEFLVPSGGMNASAYFAIREGATGTHYRVYGDGSITYHASSRTADTPFSLSGGDRVRIELDGNYTPAYSGVVKIYVNDTLKHTYGAGDEYHGGFDFTAYLYMWTGETYQRPNIIGTPVSWNGGEATVTVTEPVPVTAFTAPQSVNVATNFTITNNTTGNVDSYITDEGDGTATGTDPDANFQYASDGFFDFKLTATNTGGSTSATARIYSIPTLASLYTTSNLGGVRERYFEDAPDWNAVTASHEYQDGGKNFNELNNVAPQEWDLIYSGLDPLEAAVFDSHFDTYREANTFTFRDKAGTDHTVTYKEKSYTRSHNANQSWIQNRSMTLIKYP